MIQFLKSLNGILLVVLLSVIVRYCYVDWKVKAYSNQEVDAVVSAVVAELDLVLLENEIRDLLECGGLTDKVSVLVQDGSILGRLQRSLSDRMYRCHGGYSFRDTAEFGKCLSLRMTNHKIVYTIVFRNRELREIDVPSSYRKDLTMITPKIFVLHRNLW